MLRAVQHRARELRVARAGRSETLVGYELGKADDRIERRAQLVRHVRDEFPFEPVRLPHAPIFRFEQLTLRRFLHGGGEALRFDEPLVLRDVARDLRRADDAAAAVANRGDRQRDVDEPTVLVQSRGLEVLDRQTGADVRLRLSSSCSRSVGMIVVIERPIISSAV